MNPYIKAALVIIAAVLGAYGTAMATQTGVVNWNSVFGGMASAAGGAILGLFTNMPQRQWTDEERASKLGDQNDKA